MAGRRIFICYRREDTEAVAGRLYDRLSRDFGRDCVFMDIDNIPLGVDFRDHIRAVLGDCDVVIALIGPRWAEILNDRATNERDFVRVELEMADTLACRIAPVVVGGASLPESAALPPSFSLRARLPHLQSAPLRSGVDFDADYQRIAREIRRARSSRWRLPAGVSIRAAAGAAALALAVVLGVSNPDIVVNAIRTLLNRPVVPAMVMIPGGRFRMGAAVDEAGSSEDERPVHEVSVKTFALGVTEVTFEEYAAFAQATKRALPDDSGWGRGRQPVINVSHADAQAYAAWLSSQTGETYRLPTEAEWEYAARGGSDAAYWWGNEIRRGSEVMANCNGCGSQWDDKQAAPVGQFAANPYGLHDMHGNVMEWTQDCWHKTYEGAPSDGRAWESQDKGDCGLRVVRGGSWNGGPETLRSADRFGNGPGVAAGTLGFRLARTLP